MSWSYPDESDDRLANLPFAEAQARLTGVPQAAGTLATCGWHGTYTDGHRGAFAVVNTDGPLATLLGDRVRVSADGRAVTVYIVARRVIPEQISLARRAFLELGVLSTEELTVLVQVLL